MPRTRQEEYRAKAEECATRARVTTDPEIKQTYESLVRQWLALARRAEESGGGP